jgi:trehalose 6-phosphate phosphatase
MSQPLFDAMHEVGDRILAAPHLLVGVDYDGTLTHFVANPMGAVLSTQMQRVLLSLAENEAVSLAIFSGRDRADLQTHVDIPGVIYVGNHGLDISGPGFLFVEPGAVARTETLKELAAELERKLKPIAGAVVEYKGVTVSVHYRQAAAEDADEVRRLVHATLAGAIHPFMLTQGEKVFEIRPRVYWNKGTALNWIREHIGKPEALPIYVGDSATDEDVFTAIPEGITIKVRPAADTAARYSLESPPEVRKFLEWVDEILRNKAPHHAGQEA